MPEALPRRLRRRLAGREGFTPDAPLDLVFSNAALQWVDRVADCTVTPTRVDVYGKPYMMTRDRGSVLQELFGRRAREGVAEEECSSEDRKTIGEDIRYVQVRWPVSLPRCRTLGEGLYEIRSDVSDGCIARVLFCFDEAQIVLLHGFIKKTQKTPAAELATARKRAKLTKG